MIVFFLAGMVAMILVRALHRDISRYNDDTAAEDAKEEYGWKLVHADVFRPPLRFPMVFAALVGSGVQLLLMTFATLAFALLGFLSPANRGSLVTAFVLLFVFLSSFAGYHSSRLYKMFRGTDFKKNTLVTAFLFPGAIFSIFMILNFAVAAQVRACLLACLPLSFALSQLQHPTHSFIH
jgi:transmembrane 9 superfamily protein 2/4